MTTNLPLQICPFLCTQHQRRYRPASPTCIRHERSPFKAPSALLSSEPKCNTPADLIIGTVDQDLRECCHAMLFAFSDDEREQIGLAKAVGHSIGAIAKAIGRPRSTVSRKLSRNKLPSGRYSPLHAAGAYQLRRRREARMKRSSLRTFVVDRLAEGWTPSKFQAGSRAETNLACGPWVARRSTPSFRAAQQAEQLWRYLTRHHKRRRPRRSRPSKIHQGSRLHPRTAQACRGQNRGRPLGG